MSKENRRILFDISERKKIKRGVSTMSSDNFLDKKFNKLTKKVIHETFSGKNLKKFDSMCSLLKDLEK